MNTDGYHKELVEYICNFSDVETCEYDELVGIMYLHLKSGEVVDMTIPMYVEKGE